jgi:hypothetical protein
MAPRWVRILSRTLPIRYRSEILDDLLDEREVRLCEGRRRSIVACWLLAHLCRSAIASRRSRMDAHSVQVLHCLSGDIAHGWRRLARSPATTMLAVGTLAVGLGACSAIFGIVDPLVFGVPEISAIDRVMVVRDAGAPIGRASLLSFADYRTVADSPRSPFAEVAATLLHWNGVANGTGQAEPIQAELVSSNYFRVARQRPVAGSLRLSSEDRDPTPTVVISEPLWRRWFGRDAAVVGRTISVGGVPVTIVGVAPAAFAGMR